jgi:hypothetical protein
MRPRVREARLLRHVPGRPRHAQVRVGRPWQAGREHLRHRAGVSGLLSRCGCIAAGERSDGEASCRVPGVRLSGLTGVRSHGLTAAGPPGTRARINASCQYP